jgi:cation:H+ antiporter
MTSALLIWIIVFVASMALLIKSSDWLLDSSEKIGLRAGMSPFLVGVTIVAFGTSFPELISSFFAIFNDASEIVVSNAIGSNIANILLVVGVAALVGKKLTVTKNLIDLDLPLIALSTTLFVIFAWSGTINIVESIILLFGYAIYLVSALMLKDGSDMVEPIERPEVTKKDIIILLIGVAGLALGAKYLIDSITNLSAILNIGQGVIALTAVAIGTSLPELLVSVKAALKGKAEIALGNVFGSNIFNIFVVVGLPGLFKELPITEPTLLIAMPFLIVSSLLFIFSGISKRIHIQEGAMYLLIYIVFIGKLFSLF